VNEARSLTFDLKLLEALLLGLFVNTRDPVEKESDVGLRVARHLLLKEGVVDKSLDPGRR
jgi:hypothetical protein